MAHFAWTKVFCEESVMHAMETLAPDDYHYLYGSRILRGLKVCRSEEELRGLRQTVLDDIVRDALNDEEIQEQVRALGEISADDHEKVGKLIRLIEGN